MPEWMCATRCPFWRSETWECAKNDGSAKHGKSCCDSLDRWEEQYRDLGAAIAARRKVESADEPH